jgi:hypothetical protein
MPGREALGLRRGFGLGHACEAGTYITIEMRSISLVLGLGYEPEESAADG